MFSLLLSSTVNYWLLYNKFCSRRQILLNFYCNDLWHRKNGWDRFVGSSHTHFQTRVHKVPKMVCCVFIPTSSTYTFSNKRCRKGCFVFSCLLPTLSKAFENFMWTSSFYQELFLQLWWVFHHRNSDMLNNSELQSVNWMDNGWWCIFYISVSYTQSITVHVPVNTCTCSFSDYYLVISSISMHANFSNKKQFCI